MPGCVYNLNKKHVKKYLTEAEQGNFSQTEVHNIKENFNKQINKKRPWNAPFLA